MKKMSLVIGLALLLCLAFAAQAMAAPTVSVSAKYQGVTDFDELVSIPQVEVSVTLSPDFALIFQGGAIVPSPGVASVAMGVRYYFTPEGWRPFATLYACSWFNSANVIFFPMGTAGLEYVGGGGFRAAGELGGLYQQGYLLFTYAISLGYAF